MEIGVRSCDTSKDQEYDFLLLTTMVERVFLLESGEGNRIV